jgi:3-hydroxy-9,10-secoandrosta-1,3,5(10)-triene-9,17-dione monooxygenase
MAPGHEPSVGRPAGAQSHEPAHAAMVAKARELVPRLRERAARTEELRHLPPETEKDLHDAGLFRILQPKRIGGA